MPTPEIVARLDTSRRSTAILALFEASRARFRGATHGYRAGLFLLGLGFALHGIRLGVSARGESDLDGVARAVAALSVLAATILLRPRRPSA